MFLSKKSVRKNLKEIYIDFTQPWWSILLQQKFLAATIVLLLVLVHIFWSVLPFLIAYAFTYKNTALWGMLGCLLISAHALETYAYQLTTRFQRQCVHGIYRSAYRYVFTIDPIYHINRTSGALIAKIDRAARGYELFLDQIVWSFIPLTVGSIVMLASTLYHSWLLAGVIGVLLLSITVGGYFFARYVDMPHERMCIAADDIFRATIFESLNQIYTIRSLFVTDYAEQKLRKKVGVNMHTETDFWLIYMRATFALRMIYVAAFFVVLVLLVIRVQRHDLTPTSAIALALAFLRNTQWLPIIIKPFQVSLRALTAIHDLFGYLPALGKQSFPVLGRLEEPIMKWPVMTLEAQAISFDYQRGVLFNNHTLAISCLRRQQNKLYGVIGPSGSGKSTLCAILAGQIKPFMGTVSVNGLDMYAVNDVARRQLVVSLNHFSSVMHGTVKYNLLFGVPDNHGYDDAYLFDIVQRVGLLNSLGRHEGLKTMLEEGGLNFSIAQRQRLNFANLYIRVRYYNPSVILIDDPTCNLDDASEGVFAQLIEELAYHAITLVFTHRLAILAHAAGIIDLSLLSTEKNITPYMPAQLQMHSTYYAQLLHCTATK